MGGYDFIDASQAVMPLESGMTALSLGIETKGGFFTPLIPRGTAVPCRCTETFTTADDHQPHIKVTVYQGHSERAADNQRIGEYEVTVPDPGLRGTAMMEITFDLDPHGTFRLMARDAASGREATVRTVR